MHSDTTLLCSVQTGFLNVRVKTTYLLMLFLRKFSDRLKLGEVAAPVTTPLTKGLFIVILYRVVEKLLSLTHFGS